MIKGFKSLKTFRSVRFLFFATLTHCYEWHDQGKTLTIVWFILSLARTNSLELHDRGLDCTQFHKHSQIALSCMIKAFKTFSGVLFHPWHLRSALDCMIKSFISLEALTSVCCFLFLTNGSAIAANSTCL